MQQITSSNADRNLAAGATVLSVTPDASNPRVCQAIIYMGDGTKNLTSSGGAFSVTITIGGQTWMGGPRSYVLGTAVRACMVTDQFPVPAGAAVTIAVTSPNAGDTDVDCTAYLMSEESLAVSAAAIADSVWDEATSGHVTAGSFGVQAGAVPAASATAVLASGDVDGFTVEQTLKLLLATLVGKVSGGGTNTITIRAADDSKARVTATVDTSGNRTSLTLDAAG